MLAHGVHTYVLYIAMLVLTGVDSSMLTVVQLLSSVVHMYMYVCARDWSRPCICARMHTSSSRGLNFDSGSGRSVVKLALQTELSRRWVPWCSGYHICFTRKGSRVRTPEEPSRRSIFAFMELSGQF